MFERIIGKFISWGYDRGLQDIRNQIDKVIKQHRLMFLDENRAWYTDKDGKTTEYTFDQMVNKAIEVGKWQKNMETLGISIQDIKDILTEKYKAQKEITNQGKKEAN